MGDIDAFTAALIDTTGEFTADTITIGTATVITTNRLLRLILIQLAKPRRVWDSKKTTASPE